MSERAVVLVDGEHYPPVIRAAIEAVTATGVEVVAAVLMGGGEKLSGRLELGDVPVVDGASQVEALSAALERFRPDRVIDLCDEPVVDARARLTLASVALAAGASYRGADFVFTAPPRPVLTPRASIAVIGTGKRTGKTAIAAALARRAAATGRAPVIVAMGRGGPAEPIVTREPPSVDDLLALADRGEHAATDAYEDAVVAGVTTVAARRAGAGFAGTTSYDTVARAVAVAEGEDPALIVLEGSGTAIPPAHADATVLVVGGRGDPVWPIEGLGAFRLLISDLALVTMVEDPVRTAGTLSALTSSFFARGVPVLRTVLRPTPMEPVSGERVLVATTAPQDVGPQVRAHLEEVYGATVTGITHRLADRTGLTQDLARSEGTYTVLMTEIKAAAIDVAARAARAGGARVVLADNRPISVEGDLDEAFDRIIALAEERAGGRA